MSYLGIELVQENWIDRFPKFVLIHGTRWRIRLCKPPCEDGECYGLTECETQTVYLWDQQPPDQMLNTLIHELIHVLWREYELPERPVEERVATALGAGWAALLVQNPDLVRTIQDLRDIVCDPAGDEN